jgi:Glycerophosphoryl diester phosphodiesterase family
MSSTRPEDLRFHYFIGERHPTLDGHALFVKKLESHHSPRSYVAPTGDPKVDLPDSFGIIKNEEVDQVPGYMTDHLSIQFTLDPAGIQWQAENYQRRKFRLRFQHAEAVRFNLRRRPEYKVARYLRSGPFFELSERFVTPSAVFREGHTHHFMRQSKHGPLLDSQPLVYRCKMHRLEVCHVRVDFFQVGRDVDPSIPPLYFAYALVSGSLLKGSAGRITVPIRMPTRQQVMRVADCGELTLNFTIATALPRSLKTARTTLYRPWLSRLQKGGPILHIGHRGCGGSYTMCTTVPENTIESFNMAADAGADFVEMDIMLDADMTPVTFVKNKMK